MPGYAWRRLVWTIPILLGVSVLLWALLQYLPGDPARLLTGDRQPSEQTLLNLKERLDLTDPPHIQLYHYLSGLVRGDLGVSYQTRQPVTEIIGDTLPNSLRLALFALVIELCIAIPAGVLAAVKKDTIWDRLAFLATALLIAMPVFLLGLGFQLFFGIRLRWLPMAGIGDGGWSYYLLPALVMGLIAAAYLARVVRSAMLDALSKDHILAARANGLSTGRIIFIHALKNALPPVLALAGLHFGFLIGGAIATETVFNWPGLGRRLYIAVMYHDRPLIIGATLTMAALFILVNLSVDILQAWLNPRVRLSDRGGLDV
jgi:ABC-type dipeptide/oligopeptide/nickel transport system permease component